MTALLHKSETERRLAFYSQRLLEILVEGVRPTPLLIHNMWADVDTCTRFLIIDLIGQDPEYLTFLRMKRLEARLDNCQATENKIREALNQQAITRELGNEIYIPPTPTREEPMGYSGEQVVMYRIPAAHAADWLPDSEASSSRGLPP